MVNNSSSTCTLHFGKNVDSVIIGLQKYLQIEVHRYTGFRVRVRVRLTLTLPSTPIPPVPCKKQIILLFPLSLCQRFIDPWEFLPDNLPVKFAILIFHHEIRHLYHSDVFCDERCVVAPHMSSQKK